MVEARHDKLIFMDEMGFNLWTARSFGRAPIGERAVRIVGGQRGPNLTLCIAVSPIYGCIHYMFKRGGMTRDTLSHFLPELSEMLELIDGQRPGTQQF